MSGTIGPFAERYRAALDNPQLRVNLLRFQRLYQAGRAAAFERLATEGPAVGVAEPTFPAQRQRLAEAKDLALGYRRAYLDQFIVKAEAAGSRVFVAETA